MSAALPASRLGRGLKALMGEAVVGGPKIAPEGESKSVPIHQVRASSLNPRKDFKPDELDELASSIRQKGLIQPLIVRPSSRPGETGFEIVAGERRWRAAQKAGLHTIPVIVRELNDQQLLEIALIENVQRSDLNPIEEARGYRDLIERFQYTQEALADIIGKSRPHLANTLRLLRLPDSVQAMIEAGTLTSGHGRALIGREDAEVLAARIVERGLTVRDIEALVQAAEQATLASDAPRSRDKDPDTKAFEREVSDAVGLKVELKKGSGESGILTVRYANFDQLEYLRKRLLGTPQA